MNEFVLRRRAALGAMLAIALPAKASSSRGPVVASFSIVADLVRQIGGDAVEVVSLVGPDADAHVFEPTPQAARRLQQARVLVANGLGFEAWLPRLKASVGFSGLEVVATRGVTPRLFKPHAHPPPRRGRHAHHHGDGSDPHAWQNVRHAMTYAQNIADGLVAADPANAARYRARADDYVSRLNALDSGIRQTLAALAPDRRSVVTAHDAFGYYAEAYGLRIIPARGFSTAAEPSARDVAALIALIRRERISAVFLENIADPRLPEQLARETGAVVGGRLYSDALSPAGGPAATYIEMMEFNTAALFRSLARN